MSRPIGTPALLPPLDGDDEGFLDRARLVLRGLMHTASPASVFVVRIDNWFGDRWLGFDRAREVREPLVIPPFVPNRVEGQTLLVRAQAGYEVQGSSMSLHRHQHGPFNVPRKLRQLSPGSLIIWISGGTAQNGRGSIMAYVPFDGGHSGWYAELKRADPRGDWAWAAGRGIDSDTLDHLVEQATA